MAQQGQPQITPPPSDDEAVALIAALHAHLAATRAAAPTPTPQTPIWAIAGRLASQGRMLQSRESWVVSREWRNADR